MRIARTDHYGSFLKSDAECLESLAQLVCRDVSVASSREHLAPDFDLPMKRQTRSKHYRVRANHVPKSGFHLDQNPIGGVSGMFGVSPSGRPGSASISGPSKAL
jgi:hypothetical protein